MRWLLLVVALLVAGCSVSLISAPKPLKQPAPPVDLTVTVPTFEPVAPSPTAPMVVQKLEADAQVAQAVTPVVRDVGSLAADVKRFIAAIKIRKHVGAPAPARGGIGTADVLRSVPPAPSQPTPQTSVTQTPDAPPLWLKLVEWAVGILTGTILWRFFIRPHRKTSP